MPVQPISNVSFGKKTKNAESAQARNLYYRWVSQNQANEALKMSLGREVEDGKYQTASGMASLLGMTGMVGSTLVYMHEKLGLAKMAQKCVQITEEMKPAIDKAAKRLYKANKVFLGSAVLLWTGAVIKNINMHKANKTANERGFLSERDRTSIKTAKDAYVITDSIYNMHVK